MIVTDRFVYIHVHRSGGQFALRFIRQFCGPIRFEGYHYPLQALPEPYRHLPVLRLVRPPWEWYVSWCHFNHPKPRNHIYPVVSNVGRADIRSTVHNLLLLGQDRPESHGMIKLIEAALPDTWEGNRGAGITKTCIRTLAGSGLGYYDWLVRRMFGGFPPDRTIFLQSMVNAGVDLQQLWERANLPLTDEMIDDLSSAPPRNTSVHREPLYHLGAELMREIATLDRAVLERLNWTERKAYGDASGD